MVMLSLGWGRSGEVKFGVAGSIDTGLKLCGARLSYGKVNGVDWM